MRLCAIPAPAVSLTIINRNRQHSLAIWGPVVIDVWHGAFTTPEHRKTIEACERVIADNPQGGLFLSIVERDSPPPDEAARAQLARWSRDTVPRLAAAAIVAAGGGFRAALVRGVGVALTALMPHRVPFKFFGTVDEGCYYIAQKLPREAGGVAALREAVETLRAAAPNT